MLRLPTCLFGFAALSLSTLAAEPLHVIVAGDSSPASDKFSHDLAALLAQHGAKAESVSVSAPLALDKADVVVLYEADLKALPAGDREALEAFAKRGGGLVVVHGAAAGGDASWWKPLIGGAWTPGSRKFSSRMMLYVATDQHPIVHGASAFDVDDETLYDLDLEKDVHVLASAFTPKITGPRAERDDRPGSNASRASVFDLQPQIWAYEAPAAEGGKPHRAFVALQGAQATLDHASFRTFLLRGIAWSAGRDNLDEFCAPSDIASLRYPAGGPETPEDTVKQMRIEPGFKASVVAAEPLINKPIAAQWDASGRLWVAETPEYPNGRRTMVAEPWKETDSLVPGVTDRPAQDRISVLSEPDANGRFTKKTVFYEGLELVTGFCLYRDGVIALHEPDILWIRDTDGDGKADKVERLYTGFTPGDTHFVANHLIVAPDGWIYASMGGGADVRKPDGKEIIARISSGMFRFKPDGSAIEQVSSKGGNGFGADVTSDGELFFGQATSGNPVQHIVVPEKTLALGKVGTIGGAENVIRGRKVVREHLPDRIPLMQIDVVGGYSAACASLIYEGGAWPAQWDRSVFCTEPILNIIHREALEPNGATYTGNMVRPDAEFIYSPDYWFRPVDVAPGPDGAIYILDFYNPVIAHSDSRGPLHSHSGASVRPDREHYFGRIYRVQNDQAKPLQVPDLAKADVAGLVAALRHPNRTVRYNAHRLLMERGGNEVAAALAPLADQEKFAPARILALWGLERLNALKSDSLKAALHDADPSIRKTAALIAEASGHADAVEADLAQGLKDNDARVRIDMLRGLSATPVSPASAAALVAVFPELPDDWSKSAAVACGTRNPVSVIEAAFDSTRPEPLSTLVGNIAARLVEQQDAASFATLAGAMASKPAVTDDLKRLVLEAAAKVKPVANSPIPAKALQELLASKDAGLRAAALPVAVAAAPAGALKADIDKVVTELLAELAEAKFNHDRAGVVLNSLVAGEAANPEILPTIGKLLSGKTANEELKKQAVAALGASSNPAAGTVLVGTFGEMSAGAQTAAFNLITTRAEWTNAFLDAIDAQKIRLQDLGPANIFRLRTHPVQAVANRASTMLDKMRKPDSNKDAIIAQLQPVVTQPGNAAHGKEVFTQTCAICHKLGDIGKEVGPVLDGIGAHGPEALLIDIVDPSRQIDAGYELFNVETKDGQIQSGILAQENDARIVLRSPAGDVEIPTAQIKSRTNTHRSLMPEGFEGLGGETLRDVLAFLCGGSSQYRVLDLSSAYTADTRRGLYQSQEATHDTLYFKKFGIVNVEGVPFNIANPESTSLGGNVIVLRGGSRESFAHTLPKRVEVKVGLPVSKFYFLGGVAGWGAGKADPDGRMIVKVTIQHAGGDTESVNLHNGVEFADYVKPIDLPGSKFAEGVVTQGQLRWFAIPVQHPGAVEKLILESADNGPAATTAAITAELAK